jgi:hypothetical protein
MPWVGCPCDEGDECQGYVDGSGKFVCPVGRDIVDGELADG